MARPQPQIISTAHNDTQILEVLATPSLWMLLYNGEPFNFRSREWTLTGPKFHYKKTSYANQGSARKQVRYLNRVFNTDAFTYKEIKGHK